MNRDELHTISSDRDCPVCGEPVHWSRYWLKGWVWAQWPCRRCNSLLGIDRNRRFQTGAVSGVVGVAFAYVLTRYSFIAAFIILIAGGAAAGLLERVKVIGNRNNRYCSSCKYDLTGTLAAGITKCPECGHSIATDSPAAEKADG